MKSTYKEQTTLERRIIESNSMLSKYPDRIPVIVDCDKELSTVILKKKFLVPHDITVSHFLSVVRGKSKLDSSKAIFMFFGKRLVSGNTTLGEIYNQYQESEDYKKNDRFLNVQFHSESTFG